MLLSVVLLAMLPVHQFWYAIPLIVAVSLVYGGTRHELMGPILQHAIRAGIWIGGFMLALFLVLLVLGWIFL